MIFIVAILAAVVVVSGCTQPGNQTTQQNNTTMQPNSTNTTNSSVGAVDVVATQKGPSTAKQGDNVTITYTVSNEGSEPVYKVKIDSQNFEQTVGTLNPGETRTYTSTLHIPTNQDLQQDFKSNSTVPNPLSTSFVVIFTDTNGSGHTIQSNVLDIKLV